MIPAEHPCLSVQIHFRYGRIHLSVAPRCNIWCGYCDRRYDCANESRPGITSEVISSGAVLDRVERALRLDDRLWVVDVAGPGEPLVNPTTLETLRLIHVCFPGPPLCLSISGLVLSGALPELLDCGIFTLTVTVNTRSVVCAGHVYWTVSGNVDAGVMTAFLYAQQEGVAEATEAGLTVEIDTVAIPGVNTGEIEGIACWAARVRAAVISLMPPISQADFWGCGLPSRALLEALRIRARAHIPQFTYYRQCRANAVGVPGE